MKRILFLFLLTTTLSVFSQVQQSDRPTLNVTGSAKVNVKPDLGVLNILVSEIKPKMADAIKALGETSNHYNGLLKKLGFNEKDIRTTSFTVAANRIYRYDKYIDSGYVASQNIRLEFVYDQKTLTKIVSEFSKSEKPVNFSFDFQLSEELKQKVQSQVIEIAIKDGKEKAAVMAKAASVKLTSMKNISYGTWGRDNGMELIERKQNFADGAAASAEMQSFNFTPEDLIFRDSVNMEWVIE